MKMPVAPQPYIIQIDLEDGDLSTDSKSRPAARVDVKLLQHLLDGTGIELDAGYRPVCINPQHNRFVVRGHGTHAAKQRAERMLGEGVKFFSDNRMQAVSAPPKAH